MRHRQVWIGLSALYGLALAAVGVFYLVTGGLTTDDRLVAAFGVGWIPLVAFAAVAAPLFRGSQNRVALVGGGVFALAAAWLQLMLTWGISLPLSLPLIVLEFVAANRAAKLSRMSGTNRLVAILIVVAALLAIPTFALTAEGAVALLVLAGLACLVAAAVRARSAT